MAKLQGDGTLIGSVFISCIQLTHGRKIRPAFFLAYLPSLLVDIKMKEAKNTGFAVSELIVNSCVVGKILRPVREN